MSKKVVLVICEGVSDAIALEDYLNSSFNDKTIKFVVSSGDILGNIDNNELYLSEMIEKVIFENDNNLLRDFSLDDVLMVAHIIDTDGIFEDDSIVKFDNTAFKTQYHPDAILTKNVQSLVESRKYRRERIEDCISTESVNIKGRIYPYSIFYMSCNLEHVTHNIMNVKTEEEKVDLAGEFSVRFDCEQEFVKFLKENNLSNTSNLIESWRFIKKHSLQRATNLVILYNYVKSHILK